MSFPQQLHWLSAIACFIVFRENAGKTICFLSCDAFFIWLAPPLAYEIASGGASSKDKMRLYSVSGGIDATASGFTAVFARPRPEADFSLLIQHEF